MAEYQTLTDLLIMWKGRQLALMKMMARDYGDESPERNKIIMSMHLQQKRCIEELEEVMRGSWLVAALADSTVKANKKEN